jgi:ssDNA-binding Zn-finger/Zn-ribbon topoisomerase 1
MPNRKSTRPATPEICPVCGDDVPRGALACPECGADHQSGWSEDAEVYDGVDLPENDFNYEEFVEKEFGSKRKPSTVKTIWWVAGIVLLIAFLLYLFIG